jgi:hypothetical protein
MKFKEEMLEWSSVFISWHDVLHGDFYKKHPSPSQNVVKETSKKAAKLIISFCEDFCALNQDRGEGYRATGDIVPSKELLKALKEYLND